MAKVRTTTRNDLDARLRERMIGLLNPQLADTMDLYTQVKQAHWNVKGPHFIALHELYDKLAEELEDPIDDIAERVTALVLDVPGHVDAEEQGVAGVDRGDPVGRQEVPLAGGEDDRLLPPRPRLLAGCGELVREVLLDGDEVLAADHGR